MIGGDEDEVRDTLLAEVERLRAAHEPPAVLESNARLAEFLRCKADGAGHEDAALLGLCARAIEESSRPPPGPVSVTVPQRDLDKLIVAVHAVLDAYEGRFEIEASGGRYWGPIDDEIKALRSALTKCAVEFRGQEETYVCGNPAGHEGAHVDGDVTWRDCECGPYACMGVNRAALAGLRCTARGEQECVMFWLMTGRCGSTLATATQAQTRTDEQCDRSGG
jgi:hypothetical protein